MVKLVKQSYREAKESGLVRDCELIGMVMGTSTKIPFSDEAMQEVNGELIRRAGNGGADYVFGIDYKAMAGSNSGGTIGYGDAYKLIKDKQ